MVMVMVMVLLLGPRARCAQAHAAAQQIRDLADE
jgi:hypothetical protein